MADFARSADPAVQVELDRLAKLSPGRDVLGLERITALLDALGRPQDRLPPAFHVAGTNGKGSTCAFLRAALEASGRTVHMFTSPHLVRFNERIRVAGALLPERFTLARAQQVYEALRGEPVDAANFRRDIRATGLLEETGETLSDGPGRPGRVYRLNFAG